MKTLSIIALTVLTVSFFSGVASAAQKSSTLKKLKTIEACLKKADFKKGPDFRVKIHDRKIGTHKVMTGFKFQFADALLANNDLKSMIRACLAKGGAAPRT